MSFRRSAAHVACVLILALAAPFLLHGIESGRGALSPVSNLSLGDLLRDEFAHLTLDERVTALQRLVDDTFRQMARCQNDKAALADSLSRAQRDKIALPAKISQLAEEIERFRVEIPAATTALESAKQAQPAFTAMISMRLERVRADAAAQRDAEVSAGVERIAQERAQRNELRARIGAKREDQEEVYHSLAQKRRTQQLAEQNYVAAVRREQDKISNENALIASRVSAAEERLAWLNSTLEHLGLELEQARTTLTNAEATIAAAPARIAALDLEIARLRHVQSSQEALLQTARLEQRQRDEKLAESRARELAANQQASVSVPQYTPQYLPQATSGGLPRLAQTSYRSNPVTLGRYYDPSYRPKPTVEVVRGHFRSNGKYVHSYMRTTADDSFYNNWSAKGNFNPVTGKTGTKLPSIAPRLRHY